MQQRAFFFHLNPEKLCSCSCFLLLFSCALWELTSPLPSQAPVWRARVLPCVPFQHRPHPATLFWCANDGRFHLPENAWRIQRKSFPRCDDWRVAQSGSTRLLAGAVLAWSYVIEAATSTQSIAQSRERSMPLRRSCRAMLPRAP